ncbi:MAG: hypothetical protein AB1695_08810 [Stygiobacter sp.]|jgi:hypothetical protein|uniref:Uncharacterized protein n=1 Tax=Stygiobacter electus TaxID=3032292 RepID=A0AAE3NW15_9BACT|nr:hypothetical protein [Stygiobacter electus]MDF1611936.1 hypothetical protein [Stygiobacter electus]
MKIKLILLLLLSTQIYSQKIGKLAPENGPEIFPPNSWGADIMFGEGGFGLGIFYKKDFNINLSGTLDFSISETKDEREIDYYDPYWGTTFTPYKVNRAFLMPLNAGLQYRIFTESLTGNLRPYISAGVGPTFIVTTPYEEEFFTAFKWAKMHYGVGGYIGLGGYFGDSKKNLVGINVRYYYTSLFGNGIENLIYQYRKSFGQFYISLSIGTMF